jgi:nicotinamidase-related amidase
MPLARIDLIKGRKLNDHHIRPQNHGSAVDLYNDFLSEGGKLWPWVEEIAEEVGLLDNLRTVVRTAREAGIAIYHVPHHRWEPGDYLNWRYPSPYQLGGAARQIFAKGTWGGTFHDDFQVQPGDVVATEHWASSGFTAPQRDPLGIRGTSCSI